jgi:hypothetical protein
MKQSRYTGRESDVTCAVTQANLFEMCWLGATLRRRRAFYGCRVFSIERVDG